MSDLKYSLKKKAIKAYLNTLYPVLLHFRAKRVGYKDKIEVVFFAMNVANWHYQGVYDLLSQDERFNCHIVLTIALPYSKEQQTADLKQMRAHFDRLQIKYLDYDEKSNQGYNVAGEINPDILFFPQPYDGAFPDYHSYRAFRSKLLCYIPYGIGPITIDSWVYNTLFHNLAWKLYYPYESNKDESKKISMNHARNMLISGYPNFDKYLNNDVTDVWKRPERIYKRLIWAPHFTITPLPDSPLNRSNFLRMADLMLEIAKKYKNQLQIAFKPHPRLKSELYRHQDWGKEKTDSYYDKWSDMENTQLETGDFVDLFKTSDAMIHDSASFTIEYLYVNKPVAFVSRNSEELSKKHSAIAVGALQQHYIVTTEEEILSFVENVVIGEQDSLKEQRTNFVTTQLLRDRDCSSSQFIVNDIKRSLGLN